MTRTEIYGFRLMLIIAGAMILALATTPGDVTLVKSVNDKLGHVMAFYVLAFLADFSFPQSRFNVWKVVILLCFGLMIELLQINIPNRIFSLLDLFADAIGLMLYEVSLPGIRRMPWLAKRWKTGIGVKEL